MRPAGAGVSAWAGLGSRYTVRQLWGMWRRAHHLAVLREDADIDRFLAAIRKEFQHENSD